MKKYKLLTILIISMLVLTGCSTKKNAISVAEFNNIVSGYNLEITDGNPYGYAEEGSMAKNNSYSILFYKVKRGYDIQGMYIDEVKNVYTAAGIKDDSNTTEKVTVVAELTSKPPEKTINKGKNWNSFELITDTRYYYITMVDDTLLKVTSVIDKKDEVKKILDAMKY